MPKGPWNAQEIYTVIRNIIEYAQVNVNTAKDIVIEATGFVPRGFGLEPGIGTVTYRWNPVRTLGRSVGDATIPPLLFLGFFITIIPEQYENMVQGAQPGEYIGDYWVDSLGFGISEIAGIVFASITKNLVIKIFADLSVGEIYEMIAESGFREYVIKNFGEKYYQWLMENPEWLIEQIEKMVEEYNSQEFKPLPVPDPPQQKATPVPQ